MLDCITKDISFRKSSIKLGCLYLVQHMLHQIKAPQFYTNLDLQRLTVLNSPVDGKILRCFKAFECFPVLFKANLIFKDFSSLCEPCTFVNIYHQTRVKRKDNKKE